MSIDLVPFPNSAPVDLTDWEKMVDVTEYNSLGTHGQNWWDFSSNTLKQGVRIMIGGSLYLVSSAEAITGTPSDYVRVTPSGSTASAAYVSSLSGVSWNSVWNFYEDGSGNAYLFDEAKAELSTPRTEVGRFAQLMYSGEIDSGSGPLVINGTNGRNTLIGTTLDLGPKLIVSSTGFNNTLFVSDSNTTVTIRTTLDGTCALNMGDTSATGGAITYINSAEYFAFKTNATEAMRLTSANHLLLNTTSDPGETLHVGSGGARFTGTAGNVIIRSEGNRIEYTNAGDNLLRASASGGNLFIVTNGRAGTQANANLICNADQSVTVNTTLYVDTIEEKTTDNGVRFESDVHVDTVIDKTDNNGVYIDDALIKEDTVSAKYHNRKTLLSMSSTSETLPDTFDSAISILAISDTRLVVYYQAGAELIMYEYSGTSWSQLGNALSLSGTLVRLAKLTETDIALTDNLTDTLTTYRFDGTDWAAVGSSFSLTYTMIDITSLTETDIATIETTTDDLRVYRFNGSTWSQVGSDYNIPNLGDPGITAISSTDVVISDENSQTIRTYRFNGTTWTTVGTTTSVSHSNSLNLVTLSSTTIMIGNSLANTVAIYEWGGSSWAYTGIFLSVPVRGNTQNITALSVNKYMVYTDTNSIDAYNINYSELPPSALF